MNLNVLALPRYSCSHWFFCSVSIHSGVFTIAENVASHQAICAGGKPLGPTTARQFEVTALMPSSRQVGTVAASPLRRRGDEIASIRSFPACTCFHAEPGVDMRTSTC